MDGRVDAHRDVVRILTGDPLVHLEQVPVALVQDLPAEPLERVAEVQVDAETAGAAAPVVAGVLRLTGGDVARREVAVGRVDPLEVVVAVRLGDLIRRPLVAGRLGTHTRPSLRSDSLIRVSFDW